MSHEHHGISNHWHLVCLFNMLLRLKIKKTSKFHIIGHLWGEPTRTATSTSGTAHKGSVMRKVFPRHNLIMNKSCLANVIMSQEEISTRLIVLFHAIVMELSVLLFYYSSWLAVQLQTDSGGGFNINMPSYQYRKSHCGDQTSTVGFLILVRQHLYVQSGPRSTRWYY